MICSRVVRRGRCSFPALLQLAATLSEERTCSVNGPVMGQRGAKEVHGGGPGF